MPSSIFANTAGSISELKKNPMALVNSGNGEAVAVLNHNRPAFYCIPAEAYEALVEYVDDLALTELIEARKGETPVPVSLDEL
ncbi:type II toxin-antitoxin system Phd/YefM family antitoxin [Porticoccus sp. GXU_MW_L64]